MILGVVGGYLYWAREQSKQNISGVPQQQDSGDGSQAGVDSKAHSGAREPTSRNGSSEDANERTRGESQVLQDRATVTRCFRNERLLVNRSDAKSLVNISVSMEDVCKGVVPIAHDCLVRLV